MMEGIKLVRIDFRLIHGQVITKWSNKISATRIVVVNDALSKDEFMADIYVMAAPPGMTVDVISIDDFVANANGGEYDKGNVLVLFRGIEDCKSVVDKGIIFKQVQIGGLGSGNGRTSVVKGISIDEKDVQDLLSIQDTGAEVTFQVTPEEKKLSLDGAAKKVRGSHMLGVSIFTGIYYWIMKTDVGYAFTHALRQPLVAALWIGLIMGDVKQAIIIGAAVQILYIGLVAAGSNLPADDCLAGLIAIPIALSAGMTSAQSITLAVPGGVLGVFLDQIRKTVNVVFVHMGDKYAEDGNAKGIVICNVVLPTILSFFMRFPVPFLANMYGADAVQNFMNSVPTWLTEGFSVAGGLLPALGFALTLFVIGKKQLMPLFFVGYFLVIVSKITVFEAAIFGVCVILLVMTFSNKKAEEA